MRIRMGHRYFEAKRPGSAEIDDQLNFGGLLNRQIGWLRALEELAEPRGGAGGRGWQYGMSARASGHFGRFRNAFKALGPCSWPASPTVVGPLDVVPRQIQARKASARVVSGASPLCVLPWPVRLGPARHLVPHSWASEHICWPMKVLPAVFAVQWIADRWWILAPPSHPHDRAPYCCPVEAHYRLKEYKRRETEERIGTVWPDRSHD